MTNITVNQVNNNKYQYSAINGCQKNRIEVQLCQHQFSYFHTFLFILFFLFFFIYFSTKFFFHFTLIYLILFQLYFVVFNATCNTFFFSKNLFYLTTNPAFFLESWTARIINLYLFNDKPTFIYYTTRRWNSSASYSITRQNTESESVQTSKE